MMHELSPAEHCERYNGLCAIDHQLKAVERLDFPEILWSIAHILRRHDAHVDFGICLLHRHHDLASDKVMVHSCDLPGEDICKMEGRGKRQVFPHAYQHHCQYDDFVPYEFSSTPTPIPAKPLLLEIAALLHSQNLCQLVGLFHIASQGGPWTERVLCDEEEEQGTIATQLARNEFLSQNDIVTEWVLRDGLGSVELLAYRGCTDTEAGHKRT